MFVFVFRRICHAHCPTIFRALPACCCVLVLAPWYGTVNLQDEPPPGKDSVEGTTVQQRCEVQPGGRRGVVEFVGEVEGLQVRNLARSGRSPPSYFANHTVVASTVCRLTRRGKCAGALSSPRALSVGSRADCATIRATISVGCRRAWLAHDFCRGMARFVVTYIRVVLSIR